MSNAARLAALLLLAVALPATAGTLPQGIAIAWHDCGAPGGAGFNNQDFACTSNTVQFPLYPTLELATDVDSVFTAELVIDVDVASDPLPAWWSMDGTCRGITWSAQAQASTSCGDAWNGLGAASVQGWIPGTPGNSTRHARLLVAAGVLAQDAVTLTAGVQYTLCQVTLDSRGTSGCPAGCTTPACLVFNSVIVRRVRGDEQFFATPAVAGGNMVAWQRTSGTADCLSVPVRKRTWSAVKALYR